MRPILIIEDNDTLREGMAQVLRRLGHETLEAPNGLAGLDVVSTRKVDLVVTDYRMEGMDGLAVLREIKARAPQTEVMVVTAYGTIELAVEAMKAGAADFITKPFSPEELAIKVQKILERLAEREEFQRMEEENRYLREEIETGYGEIVGSSPAMKAVYRSIEKVAQSDSSVLIYGESGTGKELVARAIHKASPRRDFPFVRVNCGALAEGVLESELFGHERGAFTGALRRKKGRFELAHRGSLFLDEVGDLPLATQVKLLRVLQEKQFERVGGEETLQVDVRVIAATNRNLAEEIAQGRFREDLFYRLHVVPIYLPPLRERKEDIPLLVHHFLKRLSTELRKPGLSIEPTVMNDLLSYPWPGNVRELENVLERAAVLCDGNRLGPQDLPLLLPPQVALSEEVLADAPYGLNRALEEVERRMIEKALHQARGVKTEAARLLGIKTSALYYKLAKHGLA